MHIQLRTVNPVYPILGHPGTLLGRERNHLCSQWGRVLKTNQAGQKTSLIETNECKDGLGYAECLRRRIRSVPAPNGSSINAPEMSVVGSGTTTN